MITNGGEQRYEHLVVLKDLPLQVHFKEDLLANILSLRNIANMPGVKLTTDSTKERAIQVTLSSGAILKFEECPDSLYHLDASNQSSMMSNKAKSTVTPYSFAMTVAENKRFFLRKKSKKSRGNKECQG
mgnify:CR=1 FL=1